MLVNPLSLLVIPWAAAERWELGWSQQVPCLGCKVASSAGKGDTKMARAMSPTSLRIPFLQPDSWSMPGSNCAQRTTNSQPNLRQISWSCGDTRGLKGSSPEGAAEHGTGSPAAGSPKKALLTSHPQCLGWHLTLGYLYPENRWKEDCLGKDPPASFTAGNALWKGKEEDPSPHALLASGTASILVPSRQIQTCYLPPTLPHVLCPRLMNSPPALLIFSE